MRIYNFFKIALVILISSSTAVFATNSNFSIKKNLSSTAINPPKITAAGNQIYCPQTYVKIVTNVKIEYDAAKPNTDAIYIQISSGYINGQDRLSLSGSHPTIKAEWIALEGKLKLSSITSGASVSYTDFEAAIKDVEFYNSSLSPSGIRNFSISVGVGQANYLPRNGHFYEYIASPGISWTAARVAAESPANYYYGLHGYLATLTTADEAQLAGAQASGTGWIGGNDVVQEGTWKWVTGPEAGTTFNYTFWNNNTMYNEPK